MNDKEFPIEINGERKEGKTFLFLVPNMSIVVDTLRNKSTCNKEDKEVLKIQINMFSNQRKVLIEKVFFREKLSSIC
jgi:hypothetical protein